MAASRSTRVTRSSVGINGLDENFCGRTLRNRSIAQSDDSSPAPLPRARSPKKKLDSQQGAPQQPSPKGSHLGKVADAKHPPGEREPWMSPRKRGLSFSEREAPDKEESQPREASPPLKRARGRSRSGDTPGSPARPERPSLCDAQEATGGEQDSQHNEGKSEAAEDSKEAGGQPVDGGEGHGVANGLAERGPEGGPTPPSLGLNAAMDGPREPGNNLGDACCDYASLLNGRQGAPFPSPHPDVPCRNSHPEPVGPVGSVGPPSEAPLEEEVDVVGDASTLAQARAADGTNSGGCAANDEPHMSGEGDPVCPPQGSAHSSASPAHCPPGPAQSPPHTPCFSEPQEHRYALRTSPRRGRGSPPKLSSPPGEEREAEAPPDTESTSSPRGEPEAKESGEVGLPELRAPRSTKEPVGGPAAEEEDDDEDDPDVYYFESDHLALKHNKDYQRLLQTIGVLEAQRTQAILDLEALARRQQQALSDPVGFVEQLQKQMVLGLPGPQRVVQLPDIAWDQYTSGLGDFEREFCDRKRNTRRTKLIFDKVGLPARPKSPLDSKRDGESSALYSALPSSDGPDHGGSSSRSQMIRGRNCDQNKSDTFNQLWTIEEQKKLEQLLLKFPPEEVESRRWQKIADELGNRTAKQVASRVQKYFIKLTKAGIPVPGRTPNLCMYSKKASTKRQHHLNKHLYRPSTFLTSYEPPVYMDDDDDRSSFYSALQDPTAADSDEDSIPTECRHLPEYKELLELKKLKKQRLREMHMERALTQHLGYKCDACGVEPIQGVRWHCQDCPQDNAVDFCSSCSDCFFKSESHKPDHRLEPICEGETFLDRDYCLPQSVGYNYLDPNYFPANR
ncbi:ZZ-type zinc finger-containing protein 3 isoform X2 [Brienomyrus brachyistius]|nr:ZZ-type zinc finger-containing protein 3 isoform X2 [Brienomyrus brachyistius]XP_048844611.1 ZZ-type zinc finger-containing protein 3 isoform X2 [Brienomyrus brachyistius]